MQTKTLTQKLSEGQKFSRGFKIQKLELILLSFLVFVQLKLVMKEYCDDIKNVVSFHVLKKKVESFNFNHNYSRHKFKQCFDNAQTQVMMHENIHLSMF